MNRSAEAAEAREDWPRNYLSVGGVVSTRWRAVVRIETDRPALAYLKEFKENSRKVAPEKSKELVTRLTFNLFMEQSMLQKITPLRQRMLEDLGLRNYAANTRKAYCSVENLLFFKNRSIK